MIRKKSVYHLWNFWFVCHMIASAKNDGRSGWILPLFEATMLPHSCNCCNCTSPTWAGCSHCRWRFWSHNRCTSPFLAGASWLLGQAHKRHVRESVPRTVLYKFHTMGNGVGIRIGQPLSAYSTDESNHGYSTTWSLRWGCNRPMTPSTPYKNRALQFCHHLCRDARDRMIYANHRIERDTRSAYRRPNETPCHTTCAGTWCSPNVDRSKHIRLTHIAAHTVWCLPPKNQKYPRKWHRFAPFWSTAT